MTSPEERVAELSDPFNLSDEALLWRRLRAAPEWWNYRPMFEVVRDHFTSCDCPYFEDWTMSAARWPKPLAKDARTDGGRTL